ncbi:MAG: hypothetical protein AAF828_03235 [Bacteroidota bacterium]
MRYALIFLLSLFVTGLSAQSMEFGIGLSLGHSNLMPGQLSPTTDFSSITPEGGPGFGLSVYSALPITGRLFLSLNPSLQFQDQNVIFSPIDDRPDEVEEVQPVSISVPLRAELRTFTGSLRPVVGLGIGANFDLSETEDPNLEDENVTLFWEVTAGAEIDINVPKKEHSFVFRPEIFTRRSLGRVVSITGESIYNQALGNTNWSYVGLRLLFYGSGNK